MSRATTHPQSIDCSLNTGLDVLAIISLFAGEGEEIERQLDELSKVYLRHQQYDEDVARRILELKKLLEELIEKER